jgi:hypothetical protein
MTIKPGAFRFNTDSMKLEIFRGSANYEGTASMAGIGTLAAGQWEEIEATSPEVQTGGTRGLYAGGFGTSPHPRYDDIQYIQINTTGNAVDFGTLSGSGAVYGNAGFSSRTRAMWAGGLTPSTLASIDTCAIASGGNTTDFGDIPTGRYYPVGMSNSTRGLIAGGFTGPSPLTASIEYVTIAATGAGKDFGDLTEAVRSQSSFNSPTRGFAMGGYISDIKDYIQFVTISTLGNTADFGNLNVAKYYAAGCSNAVRGLNGGGNAGSSTNAIEYVTMSTLGNGTDFGDLTTARHEIGAVSSPTRGCWAGSWAPTQTNIIDYVQIMTTGNAIDFGDLINPTLLQEMGCSNGHGGL